MKPLKRGDVFSNPPFNRGFSEGKGRVHGFQTYWVRIRYSKLEKKAVAALFVCNQKQTSHFKKSTNQISRFPLSNKKCLGSCPSISTGMCCHFYHHYKAPPKKKNASFQASKSSTFSRVRSKVLVELVGVSLFSRRSNLISI